MLGTWTLWVMYTWTSKVPQHNWTIYPDFWAKGNSLVHFGNPGRPKQLPTLGIFQANYTIAGLGNKIIISVILQGPAADVLHSFRRSYI